MDGLALKLVCPSSDGMLDRIVLFPYGRLAFMEIKASGEKLRPLQLMRHGMLWRLGIKVNVLDDDRQIGGILDKECTDHFTKFHCFSLWMV